MMSINLSVMMNVNLSIMISVNLRNMQPYLQRFSKNIFTHQSNGLMNHFIGQEMQQVVELVRLVIVTETKKPSFYNLFIIYFLAGYKPKGRQWEVSLDRKHKKTQYKTKYNRRNCKHGYTETLDIIVLSI